MAKLIQTIIAMGLWYLIGSFVGGSFHPFDWHWAWRLILILLMIVTVGQILDGKD
jgi:hypothetical protein